MKQKTPNSKEKYKFQGMDKSIQLEILALFYFFSATHKGPVNKSHAKRNKLDW